MSLSHATKIVPCKSALILLLFGVFVAVAFVVSKVLKCKTHVRSVEGPGSQEAEKRDPGNEVSRDSSFVH